MFANSTTAPDAPDDKLLVDAGVQNLISAELTAHFLGKGDVAYGIRLRRAL